MSPWALPDRVLQWLFQLIHECNNDHRHVINWSVCGSWAWSNRPSNWTAEVWLIGRQQSPVYVICTTLTIIMPIRWIHLFQSIHHNKSIRVYLQLTRRWSIVKESSRSQHIVVDYCGILIAVLHTQKMKDLYIRHFLGILLVILIGFSVPITSQPFGVLDNNAVGGGYCPPQETILPCRCSANGEEIQIW